MKNRTLKIALIILALIAAAGIGYYLQPRDKARLNVKIDTKNGFNMEIN